MKPAVHQYEDKLLELAYGELGGSEREAVEAHVRGCPRCTQALGEIGSVRSTMSQLPHEAAPNAGLESLLAYAEQTAARNAEASKPARSTWLRFLVPLGSVAALVVVGFVAFKASPELSPVDSAVASKRESDLREAAPQGAGRAEGYGNTRLAEGSDYDAKPAAPQAVAAATPSLDEEAPAAAPPNELSKLAAKGSRGATNEALQGDLGYLEKKADKSAERQVMPSDSKRRAKEAADDAWGAGNVGTVAKRNMAPEPAPAFGMSGGGIGTKSEAPIPARDQLADAPKQELARKDNIGGLSSAPTSAGPSPAPVVAAKPMPPPKSLSLGQPAASQAEQRAGEEDEARVPGKLANDGVDRLQTNKRATQKLDEAESAAGRGDTRRAVELALEALADSPSGSARLDALTRVCNGYVQLGEVERADPYCDALVREFPTSMAAQRESSRRGYQQRAVAEPKAAASKKAKTAPMLDSVEPASAPTKR